MAGRTLGPSTTRVPRRPMPAAVSGQALEDSLPSRFTRTGSLIRPQPAVASRPRPAGEVDDLDARGLSRLSGVAAPGAQSTVEKRRRSVWEFATYLERFDGATWQDRWLASGWESSDRPVRVLNPPNAAGWSMSSGFKWLSAMRAIVPSMECLRRDAVPDYAAVFIPVQQDRLLAELAERIEAASAAHQLRQRALTHLSFALTSQAITTADLTPEALMHFAWQYRDAASSRNVKSERFGGALVWDVLASMGHFPPGTPASMRQAMVGGRQDVTGLVDRYRVRHPQVRQLLIDYITHRHALGMDYGTIRALTTTLVRNFWCLVEQLNPDQADLSLSEETYLAWRRSVDVVQTATGTRPRGDIYTTLARVRGFYLDLQSWAADEPERWARWVTRCPIPQISGRAYAADRRRLSERMADRTRQRQPLLPLLARFVAERWQDRQQLYEAALRTQPGQGFQHGGRRYTRHATDQRDHAAQRARGQDLGRLLIRDKETGETLRADVAADHAFWDWAVVEVLRLTGIRHEELLELTHLSIRQYQRPNGEVVPLLVIAPSKTDRERVIPMSADLFHVIAQIIRHHTRDRTPGQRSLPQPGPAPGPRSLPLIRRWDPHERVHSPPLPFLFQHQVGTLRSVFSTTWVLKSLRRSCAGVAEQHPQFTGLRFTPHDFRRIFATELVNNGLPIHIGAALLGHTNLQTTSGYVAVFDDDVVRHYQQFLAHRRQMRPAEEYHAVGAGEWAEFEEHFDKRKVELGACGRPYGTPCAHEHACIRCPMLHVNPAMLTRLDELEADLIRRRDQATEQGWRGELEGLDLTLSFLREKRDQARRLTMPAVVHLGLPRSPGLADENTDDRPT